MGQTANDQDKMIHIENHWSSTHTHEPSWIPLLSISASLLWMSELTVLWLIDCVYRPIDSEVI